MGVRDRRRGSRDCGTVAGARRDRRCCWSPQALVAGFGLLLVLGSTSMWFGRPGEPALILPLLVAYGIATVGVEFAIVFNNAMMPSLVALDHVGRLSGTGWAVSYVGGITSLIVVLGFLAADPQSGRTCSVCIRCSGSILPPIRATASRDLDRDLVHRVCLADVCVHVRWQGEAQHGRGAA